MGGEGERKEKEKNRRRKKEDGVSEGMKGKTGFFGNNRNQN